VLRFDIVICTYPHLYTLQHTTTCADIIMYTYIHTYILEQTALHCRFYTLLHVLWCACYTAYTRCTHVYTQWIVHTVARAIVCRTCSVLQSVPVYMYVCMYIRMYVCIYCYVCTCNSVLHIHGIYGACTCNIV